MIDFKYPNRIMKHPVLKNINEMLEENAQQLMELNKRKEHEDIYL